MEKINKILIDLLINENYNSTRYVIGIDDILVDDLKKSDIIEFTTFCMDFLGIGGDNPKLDIKLTNKVDNDLNSFAYYVPSAYHIYVNCKDRHKLDIFRSLAHEIVHYKQDINGELTDVEQLKTNNDGAPIENEANSIAGVIMREYGRKRPDLFK